MNYTRVSTNGQKDYLKNQIEFLLNFTSSKGIIVDETIEDIGSGLNYNRKKWNKLIEVVLCQYFGHKKSNFFMLHF